MLWITHNIISSWTSFTLPYSHICFILYFNRFDYSEKYTFSLQLVTATAQCVEDSSTTLTNQIIRNRVPLSLFHLEFDNFDMLINDMTGGALVHTAHDIVLQKVFIVEGTYRELPSVTKTGRRSLELKEPELPDCYLTLKIRSMDAHKPAALSRTGRFSN